MPVPGSLDDLHRFLQETLSDARLLATPLPGVPELQLWLLDPANLDRAFSSDETRRLLETPPYWGFCWGSGLALARWVLDHPEQVRGKRVLDFGAGSGVVALACSAAGASRSIACDLDHPARLASALNADLNGLAVELAADYFTVTGELDLILAADVLYDRDNHGFLDHFLDRADQVLVADSRVRNLQHPRYPKIATLSGQTCPDLGEPLDFRQVSLYRATT
ncbi:ribosomal protein l11 methyltransferase [Pseudomonas saudimassiliensis]|uniref:Ribosomal protein l11 methyltransferase n=1 Tax=Pseudomonas saudimassiliensis TaxID=1461581 RepID=A0A078MK78_9PSED|nr:50S ribosomal protein L11 methyltransferase [Pseudomonas saudimassiliensis]CEA06634.1 ribosomal protein l11 methyltransferase [Pseudomonas saudimassiliensis]CEF28013.1 ribosomal protein l11 methyltransferase [Pseudomonas saudimassiliensis]